MPNTLAPGQPFPEITVPQLGGGDLALHAPGQLVIVYRGQHCPKCETYLADLENLRPAFADAGITTVAVSADTPAQAKGFIESIGYNGAVGYGLTEDQMQALGLYISAPRSPPETDHNFPEPGLFYVDADGVLSLVDISNAPFMRPDLQQVLDGILFAREKGFPIRGRHGL